MTHGRSTAMARLAQLLGRLPATEVIATSEDVPEEAAELEAILASEGGVPEPTEPDGRWWVKMRLDIRSHMAWHVIQELGHILNYISLSERLPTVFMPTSAPPYLNGGPDEYLHWVIESTTPDVAPEEIANVLEGRLPEPVDDLAGWMRCDSDPCDVPGEDSR